MSTLRIATLSGAVLTAVLLSSGAAVAAPVTEPGTESGTWPAAYPLPLDPGTLLAQGSTTAVVRSTDTPFVVKEKLDALYVDGLGCTRVIAVNKPRDYLCGNAATGNIDEVYFTFAALEPSTSDGSASQTNAFYVAGGA